MNKLSVFVCQGLCLSVWLAFCLKLIQVEESMENLLDILYERDRAVNLLETGKTGDPEPYLTKDILGREYMKVPTEHRVPLR